MSGGSYNYIYCKIDNELNGYMHDDELNDLVNDLVEVCHDLEWWQSADTSEASYRETVRRFKEKWFHADRETRLKGYIDKKLNAIRKECYNLLRCEDDNK